MILAIIEAPLMAKLCQASELVVAIAHYAYPFSWRCYHQKGKFKTSQDQVLNSLPVNSTSFHMAEQPARECDVTSESVPCALQCWSVA